MKMIRMTEAELQHGIAALAARVRHGPVTIITDESRDEFVVLSAEEYGRRKRRVGLTEDLPEEWIDAVRIAKATDEFAVLDPEQK
jgi:hypothetical protein